LVNAVYFKGPWSAPFAEDATKPLPFHTGRGPAVAVATMRNRESLGYLRVNGLTVVSIPYGGGDFQFLVILPDDAKGLSKVEANLTAAQLAAWATLAKRDVNLYLPKFKIESSSMLLTGALQELGMTSAFDKPPGSANYNRMAPRRMEDYLYISNVFHKAYLSLDEKGTEAAAATAMGAVAAGVGIKLPDPIEVRVDHPFLFAIQHRSSGACLFLGHVTDPR
jgi:serpin B